jgi:hypothetical protein
MGILTLGTITLVKCIKMNIINETPNKWKLILQRNGRTYT